MPINQNNGVLQGSLKVSEFIDYLNEHKSFYGDTDVVFHISGDDEVKVQFDHFKDAIIIDVYEDID